MISFEDMEQLVAFAECGRLSKAAEKLNISQPTITRTMKHLEDEFGIRLFERSRNRIFLNDTGQKAVEHARKLLADAEYMLSAVQAYDQSLRTIVIESCAPAPLWYIVPQLAKKYPAMTLSSSLAGTDDIMEHVRQGICQLGIVLTATTEDGLSCRPYIEERLEICLPANHPA